MDLERLGSTDHFGTKFVIFQTKNGSKIGVGFQMFAILRDFRTLTVLEITLALVCVVETVPTDDKDNGNTRNRKFNGGNNSHTQTHTVFTVLYLFSGQYKQVSGNL